MKKIMMGLVFAIISVLSVNAKAAYPEKPVRIIVPFPAGQTTDILARTFAQQLSETLGQNFYVENKGGAGGIIGMEAGKHAEADGYTLIMTSSGPLAINPGLYPKLPYDTLKDFSAVSVMAVVPQFLVTKADFPANNLKELIAYVKKQAKPLNYASGGTGLTNHLTMEMFKREAGVDLNHVPYKGAAAALVGLMAGDVSMMFESGPVVVPHIQKGTLKVFAVGIKRGSQALPDVPSVDKAGVPGFDATTWAALVVPKGTPGPIVEKLNAAMQTALKNPAVQQRFTALGAEVSFNTPDEAQAFIRQEVGRWGDVIKAAKVVLD